MQIKQLILVVAQRMAMDGLDAARRQLLCVWMRTAPMYSFPWNATILRDRGTDRKIPV